MIRNIQAADNIHQRRLAAAGGTDDADKLPGIDVQRGMIQRPDPFLADLIYLAKVLNVDHTQFPLPGLLPVCPPKFGLLPWLPKPGIMPWLPWLPWPGLPP